MFSGKRPWHAASCRGLVTAVCAILYHALVTVCGAENPSPIDSTELMKQVAPTIVKIEAIDRQGPLEGTGFFVDENGTIATSYSVGGESTEIEVIAGSLRLPAERLLADLRSGLALLKITAKTPLLRLAEEPAAVGASTVAIGYPLGGDLALQEGTIVAREIRSGSRIFATTHLRALIQAQPGMGGAPILNHQGQVLGIVISRTENSVGCFALPAMALRKVLSDHATYGEVRHGWIGVELEDFDPSNESPQARIRALVEGGPSVGSGLAVGDIVLRVGMTPVKNAYDILDASFFLSAGRDETVVVDRNGQVISMVITPTEHPAQARMRRSSKSAALDTD
ncbi:MAG: S1C family serine protease [Verrucomicrobiia bacterium]